MGKKMTPDKLIFNLFGYVTVSFLALACMLPVVLILSGSLTSNERIVTSGFGFIPKEISYSAYSLLFESPTAIMNAYKTSLIVTICGTLILLFMSSMAGYVLSRKDYKYRNYISFYLFFTTIFGGGLIPWYILMVQYLHMKEHPLMAMIIPLLFNYFFIIILRSFMSTIPAAISESAKIDGANDFIIYLRLIMPLSKPVLATVVLFGALNYWNDFFNALLFVNRSKHYPLQYFLYQVLNSAQTIRTATAQTSIPFTEMPTESFKLAMTIVTIGPIILLYPFVQKYFIKGLTIGAVKG